ncbi:hypothetical protein SFRURICE_001912 [Spodoptera frugiperda]|nr:hypothetical protein SFRURICE_001912 [Spodoptera frugiperda]
MNSSINLVHQHRTRHRRQGAGLYLPASYVIPGGEGSGPWGDWGEISPCSRTCGGGVASQKRICLEPGPRNSCTGGDTKYFSCQTQDCPAGSGDFRAEQCAEFNDVEFRGYKYNWVPYTKAPNPCELNCMPHAERFYFRHKKSVIDGTRCNDDSFDVCVAGVCQHVGCDMMLGSSASEDKCRECRGNGTNCHTMEGLIDSQDLLKGYNDILLIPEGSTTIIIEEIQPSNNCLALRAKNGTYYLNGHYHIDFPRSIMIAGALWTYERSQQGFPAPDKLRCLGPITEPLIPNNSTPPTDKQYNWVHEEFTPCSATCGGGYQTRNVTCRSREELEVVDSNLCDEGLKPPTNQSCNQDPCPAQWVAGPWGDCSKRCGSGGVKSREVTCQKVIANGIASIVPDKECFDLLGPKPELFQKCNEDAPCPDWFCDKLCDEGKQRRQVVCRQKINGRVTVLGDGNCTDEKPTVEQKCMIQPCDGVDWVTSDWSGCDTCFSKIRTRSVTCATKGRQVLNDSFCTYHNRPVEQEECEESKLPPCEVQWYATQWSKCSVECGDGVQTRKVFCGLLNDDSVEKVEDAKCAHLPKYNDTKPCSVPKEKCPAQWFTGPWTECSKKCGGGEQYRRVMCLRGSEESTDCPGDVVLDSTQFCNTGPCDQDTLLPVDKHSTVVTDDYDDCEEDEMEEVGLDFDLTTYKGTRPQTHVRIARNVNALSCIETHTTAPTDPHQPGVVASVATKLGSSPITDSTSSDSDSTESSASTPTGLTDETEETAKATGSDSTSSDETGGTVSTEATTKDTTGSTEEEDTTSTDSSLSTDAKETGSTEATSLAASESTGTSDTSSTSDTESTDSSSESDKTTENVSASSIGTDETSSTGETDSTVTEETSGTESTSSEDTDSTESTITKETSSTESAPTDTSSATESTPTESTVTEESSPSESTITEETDTTGTTDASETDVTGTATDTSSTDTEETTDDLSTTEPEETTTPKEVSSTDSSESTIETSSTSEVESTTTAGVTIGESDSTTAESGATTEESGATTEESGATTEESGATTVESGSTTVESESTTAGSGSTTVESGSTTEESGSTTVVAESSTVNPESTTEESGSTTSASTNAESEETEESTTGAESTTENVESSSVAESTEGTTTEAVTSTPEGDTTVETTGSSLSSGSTEESSAASETESTVEGESTTVSGETTTEISGSSTEQSTTSEGATSTESPAESSTLSESTTGSESSTELGTEETTGLSGFTTTEESTSAAVSIFDTKLPKSPVCKPRRKPKCNKTKFGCCPDNKTTALGPFDEANHAHARNPPTVAVLTVYPRSWATLMKACPVEACADTLFGCCLSDNKTAAQGNDQEGCPPPPPACAASEFGCCADNETEATGPKKAGCPETSTTAAGAETTSETTEALETSEGSTTTSAGSTEIGSTLDLCSSFEFGCCADNQTEAKGPDSQGCPCNATEFGCCPDGVSPAKGADSEGCPGPCSTSPYGCCEDNKTPAHGPNFEGCCLLQAFGCCPDNRKPAEGPHLEGCGCQYSIYGCCPDNVTNAQGADNQGCGCQYTQHGCCPDRHTAAAGPNNEGCDCSTFQFGCCPDGVTIAKGPDQQGCHCHYSLYGCCGDGVTPATGPDAAGCDCSSSRYGCCPDGNTEATGPKFFGCTDIPEIKQAACSLPTDPGSCHNFTAMWYFDMTYGGCSRFWYGGCEGNGNRFATKEDCEDVCVQPSPKDACNLPSVKGACDGSYEHWHYNSTREQCVPFLYGGCLGNANNFETRELCQKQCEPKAVEGQCDLPIEQGSCAGNFSRWGFNPATRSCEQFIWGGCEGNSNRFNTEAACRMRCNPPGSQPPQCAEAQEAGSCGNKEALWSFSVSENRCVPFYYSGCGGNNNRFPSREACEQTCPAAYVPDKCTLPAETGQCSNYRERWFFDTTFKRCRQFYYGGCGGNENNFATEAECENSCAELRTTTTTTTTTVRPVEPPPQAGPGEPSRPDICFLDIDAGPCDNMQTRFAYDRKLGRCVTFEYGGCAGNQNNFPDLEYCSFYCHPIQDICQLPMLAGPCDDSQMRWFYDPSSDSCSQFTYGGCEGNDNRFETREACESRCKTGPVPAATTPSTTVAVSASTAAKCGTSRQNNESACPTPTGSLARSAGTPAPSRHRRLARGHVCKQAKDEGPCQSYVTKVYFDAATGRCREFSYGGCLGGANRFSTVEECNQVCETAVADPCVLPPEAGTCSDYIRQWYYDPAYDQCNQFAFTGCGGNANRFETRRDCESRCKRPELRTTTTVAPQPQPQPQAEPECKTPTSLEPCGNNVTVFYYDAESRRCLVSGFGGCEHPNSYRTEEECERTCGAFRGLDVCGARLDPGPCRASIPKIYWDDISTPAPRVTRLQCDPNVPAQECESVCGGTGPDPNQVPVPDCTAAQQQCEALDCQYGVARFMQDGCVRCQCNDDPCVRANCSSHERCVAVAVRNPAYQEPQYSATCVEETNEIDDCEEYVANCSRLRCEYNIQRTRMPNGCDKCSCVQLETDCTPLIDECATIKCNYGVQQTVGADGCQRCSCKEYPCEKKSCPPGDRCVVIAYNDGIDLETKYTADCRTVSKPGVCPMDETTTNEVTCRRECYDDADCRGVGKCCRRGCSDLCLAPVEPTSPPPVINTTLAPDVPAPPQALPQQEPEVAASEGGKATLRCLFHGNPPPKITSTAARVATG